MLLKFEQPRCTPHSPTLHAASNLAPRRLQLSLPSLFQPKSQTSFPASSAVCLVHDSLHSLSFALLVILASVTIVPSSTEAIPSFRAYPLETPLDLTPHVLRLVSRNTLASMSLDLEKHLTFVRTTWPNQITQGYILGTR